VALKDFGKSNLVLWEVERVFSSLFTLTGGGDTEAVGEFCRPLSQWRNAVERKHFKHFGILGQSGLADLWLFDQQSGKLQFSSCEDAATYVLRKEENLMQPTKKGVRVQWLARKASLDLSAALWPLSFFLSFLFLP
jgi:hypothetical protein